MYWCYVLRLEEGNYYVGISANVKYRLYDHFHGNGAKFTRKFAPLEVVEKIECPSEQSAKRLEHKKLCEYSDRYGRSKVRGAGRSMC